MLRIGSGRGIEKSWVRENTWYKLYCQRKQNTDEETINVDRYWVLRNTEKNKTGDIDKWDNMTVIDQIIWMTFS